MTEKEKAFHIANHEQAAAHHVAMAEQHKKSADAHSALAEHSALTSPSASAHHRSLAEAHKTMATQHCAMGEDSLAHCKTLNEMPTAELQSQGGQSADVKSLCDRLDKMLTGVAPIGVSAIPTTPIPRFGQRPPTDLSKIDEKLMPIFVDTTASQ